MNIIIKDRNKIKGKSVSEFQRNLVSEGYPSEVSPAQMDRIKYAEKKYGPDVFRRDNPRRK